MKPILAALLLLSALATGCADDFHPITDDEVAALGLTQGVAGNTAKKVGNCQPSVGGLSSSCKHEPLDAALWLIPEAKADTFPDAPLGSRCQVDVAHRQSTEADALVVASLLSGRFGLEASPGRYMPLIVEADGCGSCLGALNGGIPGGDVHTCPTVEVAAGKVTKMDVLLERAAY